MATTRISGSGLGLTQFNLVDGNVNTNTNIMTLAAGETFMVPAGQWHASLGPYTWLQDRDPITNKFRTTTTQNSSTTFVNSDGNNVRIANLTGCPLGAVVTNVGSGYTSAPTVTASAGNSTWLAIVGGAINTTVTITTAGAGYVNPPVLLFSPPPAGGVAATGYATVSGGAITGVTVVNQGAGYTSAPVITVVPDPRDTITTTAVLTVNATLVGAQTITAIITQDHGQAVTAVPTLTISGGGGSSAAATAVMAFTATGFTVGAGGAGYGNAQPFLVEAAGGVVAATAAAGSVNPQFGTSIFAPRTGFITGTSTAGGAITATGAVIQDGGLFQAVPSAFVIAGGSGLATTQGQATITVGGSPDTILLQRF